MSLFLDPDKTTAYIREHPDDTFELLSGMWTTQAAVIELALTQPELLDFRRAMTPLWVSLGVMMAQFEQGQPLEALKDEAVANARFNEFHNEAMRDAEGLIVRFEQEHGPIAKE